jgi:hypothetical protein
MGRKMIPMPIVALVARLYEEQYTHSQFENIFYQSGTKTESPGGNKLQRVTGWLRLIDRDEPEKALAILGKILEPYLEGLNDSEGSMAFRNQEMLREKLLENGLRYSKGGKLQPLSAHTTGTATLDSMLSNRDFPAVSEEFARATARVDTEPREAASAAANILEAICKEYIVRHTHLSMPAKKDLTPVFEVVRRDLGFDPSAIEDDDLKTILGGLVTIVHGIASLRTHASSAHAQGTSKRQYRLSPRHARLAVAAAHSLVAFILETWEAREQGP